MVFIIKCHISIRVPFLTELLLMYKKCFGFSLFFCLFFFLFFFFVFLFFVFFFVVVVVVLLLFFFSCQISF